MVRLEKDVLLRTKEQFKMLTAKPNCHCLIQRNSKKKDKYNFKMTKTAFVFCLFFFTFINQKPQNRNVLLEQVFPSKVSVSSI